MNGKKYLLVFLITTLAFGAVLTRSFGETAFDKAQLGAQGSKSSITERGPFRVHPSNPRYFTNGSGKAIYLTGLHTWSNLQDRGSANPPPPFDYTGYLDFMQVHNHNFMRMWAWENAWTIDDRGKHFNDPIVYERIGPRGGVDGSPKFDLSRFNRVYFNRLRQRVIAARDRGIYVSIMLFQGWSIEKKEGPGNPWPGHPINIDNNINGINGDANGDGEGKEVHTLLLPAVVRLQEAYVRKVIDTVNDLDNVLYEIANESHSGSDAWQKHMIDFIHAYEAVKPKQHPVIYSAALGYDGTELWRSRAEAISPGWPSKDPDFVPYRDNPPLNDGRKIIINDTDHLWGIGGNHQWVWKSFLRGLNPIFMDPYTAKEHQNHLSKREWELIRKNMGHTLTYAIKMDLASMVPRNDLCSTKYCLANPGKEYLVYLPSRGHRGLRWFDKLGLHKLLGSATKLVGWNEKVTVDLLAPSGTLHVEWFNPRTGETVDGGVVKGGGRKSLTAPFTGNAVLYIYKP